MTPAVTVRGLLEARPESVGLSIELLAGAGGLQRKITSPYIQKTVSRPCGVPRIPAGGRICCSVGEAKSASSRALPQPPPTGAGQVLQSRIAVLLLPAARTSRGDPYRGRSGGRADPENVRADRSRDLGKLTAVLEDRLAHREIIHGVLFAFLAGGC